MEYRLLIAWNTDSQQQHPFEYKVEPSASHTHVQFSRAAHCALVLWKAAEGLYVSYTNCKSSLNRSPNRDVHQFVLVWRERRHVTSSAYDIVHCKECRSLRGTCISNVGEASVEPVGSDEVV